MTNSYLKSPARFYLLIIIILSAICYSTAQTRNKVDDDTFISPAKEEFQPASDVVGPWADSGCLYTYESRDLFPGCLNISGDEQNEASYLALYNSDGSVWHSFSIEINHPEYLLKKPKAGFLPLAAVGEKWTRSVLLRMVGESQNWYEVEVNEQTRETKFASKSTPRMWAKAGWDYWLFRSNSFANHYFTVNEKRELLRNQPDGEVVEKPGIYSSAGQLKIQKVAGDWAYVLVMNRETMMKGWIRWRSGREFLVGTVFNNFKIPEPKLDAGTASLK